MAQKRGFSQNDNQQDSCNDKKPRSSFFSVVLEAMKMQKTQTVSLMMEPVLRQVVKEEMERALAKFTPNLSTRTWPKQLQSLEATTTTNISSGNFRLMFQSRLAYPIFTFGKVEGEDGTPVCVVLQDVASGEIVNSGNVAMAKLDIVVLEGDFPHDEDDDWAYREFERYEVKEREGKRPLLTGDLSICLKDGIATICDLSFTDNSSWIRSRKFRLGIKVSPGSCEGVRIREGRTEAFTVKDHRGELYKKHYPPSLHDEVWRLEKIGKDGAYHKRLGKEGIMTVQDFLRTYYMEHQKLLDIFGSNTSKRMWDAIIEHAKTCVVPEKYQVYFPEDNHGLGVVFNAVMQPVGLSLEGHHIRLETLSEDSKVYMDRLVPLAYQNLNRLVDFYGSGEVMEQEAMPSQGRGASRQPGIDAYNSSNMNPLEIDLSITGMDSNSSSLPSTSYSRDFVATCGGGGGSFSLSPLFTSASPQVSSAQDMVATYGDSDRLPPLVPLVPSRAFPMPEFAAAYDGGGGSFSLPPLNSVPLWTPLSSFVSTNVHQIGGGYFGKLVTEGGGVHSIPFEGGGESELQKILREFSSDGGSDSSSCLSFSPPNDKTYHGWVKLKAVFKWGVFRKASARQKVQIQEID